MKQEIIGRGAEALLIHQDGKLIKRRVPKGYRHPDLDKKIRTRRTRSEAKLLEKAGKIINIPKVLKVDDKKAEIDMEFISGKKLSDHLDELPLDEQEKICFQIGENVAILHQNDLIHGDLTTSNMILSKEKIFFIDFGLGFHSSRIEDKAVDLHLLRQALESKHFKRWQRLFDAVLLGYKKLGDEAVILQLKKVESRGRYKGHH
jgi:Kae1-associated kinase Bud32